MGEDAFFLRVLLLFTASQLQSCLHWRQAKRAFPVGALHYRQNTPLARFSV